MYFDRKFCYLTTLDLKKVKGKIVLCVKDQYSGVEKSLEVSRTGGVGLILANGVTGDRISPEAYFVPTSMVSEEDGLSILSYIHNTK